MIFTVDLHQILIQRQLDFTNYTKICYIKIENYNKKLFFKLD